MSLFSLDSSYLPSQAKKVDCHALPSDNARNDSKNATNKKVDSSDEAFLSSLRGSGDSHNEAIHKNAKMQKVDSRIFTQAAQLTHHDSRICGGASGAFCGFWGRARLEVCGYPKINKIAAMDTQNKRSAVSLESRIA